MAELLPVVRILPVTLLAVLAAGAAFRYRLHARCPSLHLDGDLVALFLLAGGLPFRAPVLVKTLHLLALLLAVVPELTIAQPKPPACTGSFLLPHLGVNFLEVGLCFHVERMQVLTLLAHPRLGRPEDGLQGHASLPLLQTSRDGWRRISCKALLLLFVQLLGAVDQGLHGGRIPARNRLVECGLEHLGELSHGIFEHRPLLRVRLATQGGKIADERHGQRDVHVSGRGHLRELLELGGRKSRGHRGAELFDPRQQGIPGAPSRQCRAQ
mmetsp:Transcript_26349/g.61109  ORF Transcript_26349/g.61109 Transcript_26349/m.61109 type:complete len:269 (+) Transcript_26349:2309-3115(+)